MTNPPGGGPDADPRFLAAVATAEAIERGVTSPRWPQVGLLVVERGPLSIFPLARAANTDPEEGLARLCRQLSMELRSVRRPPRGCRVGWGLVDLVAGQGERRGLRPVDRPGA